MKQWNKTEINSAKIKVSIQHKMGNINVESKNLIIRPKEMDPEDFDQLLEIFVTYGKPK